MADGVLGSEGKKDLGLNPQPKHASDLRKNDLWFTLIIDFSFTKLPWLLLFNVACIPYNNRCMLRLLPTFLANTPFTRSSKHRAIVEQIQQIQQMHSKYTCTTYALIARCLLDVCSAFAWCLLHVGYALCTLHICLTFARCLLDACLIV